MKTLRKKIVLLGAFGVGKTSLVRRFISNEFSENYLSTIGVRVEKSIVKFETVNVELLLWDIAGDDEFFRLQTSYLRGASGVLLVADATRAWTLQKAQELKNEYQPTLPPTVLWEFIINKSDLPADPGLDEVINSTEFSNAQHTSAKTGDFVAEIFRALATKMISPEN